MNAAKGIKKPAPKSGFKTTYSYYYKTVIIINLLLKLMGTAKNLMAILTSKSS